MKQIILCFIGIIFFCKFSYGQDWEKYSILTKEAYGLYENKEYLRSGQKYSEAFALLGHKGLIPDRYNAACSWALAGKNDSAFVILFKISQSGYYTNLEHILADSDLTTLHSDKRWYEVVEIVKQNNEKEDAKYAKYDRSLIAILDTVYEDDQKYRKQLNDIEKEYAWDSEKVRDLWKTIEEKDSINLVKVSKILDERGWLSADIVGQQGNTALFLVIQHAELEVQAKYLPMMRDAVEKGNARASSLALLEDRVALKQGKKQIYGSQITGNSYTGEYYVQPLEDPDNVNERRAKVGLGKIEDYVARWNIIWNVEEYKKKLPELEERHGIK